MTIEIKKDVKVVIMNKGLDKYLEEIGKAKLLTIDEELELVKAVQQKGTDCDEMKQLEKASARFVVSVANQYKDKGLTLMELVDAGMVGLRRAALKYDLKTDFKFIAYAVWWIRQAIIQAIEEKK
jgi:RNA polymerase primary sigma factor